MPFCSTGMTLTASGRSTKPLTTYSRKACIRPKPALGRGSGDGSGGGCNGSGCDRFSNLTNEAGHRVAWLRAFADPILRPLVVQGEIVALLQWLISADLLNELPV